MKKLTCLILMFFSFAIQAQDLSGGANEILNKLAVKYKAFPSISIQFTMRIEENKKETGKINGEVLLKANMYKMTIPGQVTYCDGETIWTYQKEVNEISLFEYDESDENMINPVKLLDNWEKNYTAILIRNEIVNGNAVAIIDITPVKQQSYYKIRIFMDEVKNEIIGFSIYETDNSVYIYNFNKVATNLTPQKSDFQLKTTDFPGAEINDMR